MWYLNKKRLISHTINNFTIVEQIPIYALSSFSLIWLFISYSLAEDFKSCFCCTHPLADRFMMMSLEFHQSCRYDFVEVRDGDSIDSRVIARFCGNNRPALVQSSGPSLHILFVSDGYKNFDGFFATFQESSGRSKYHCYLLAITKILWLLIIFIHS